ncbi:hypothetical protein DSO57_1028827 [Entomophthora muscae]|uniref:Uncharacterized protein n=1 Tax=Entomophthora muscae TaxID=34485 RepID=A0ACC2TNH6_9FUNG|nr:hypothetical protein DSO57_1028827 [Entomophthora muscae]
MTPLMTLGPNCLQETLLANESTSTQSFSVLYMPLVVNNGIHHVLILPLLGHFEDKSLAFAFDSQNELASTSGNMIVWFPDSAATYLPHSCLWQVILPSW